MDGRRPRLPQGARRQNPAYRPAHPSPLPRARGRGGAQDGAPRDPRGGITETRRRHCQRSTAHPVTPGVTPGGPVGTPAPNGAGRAARLHRLQPGPATRPPLRRSAPGRPGPRREPPPTAQLLDREHAVRSGWPRASAPGRLVLSGRCRVGRSAIHATSPAWSTAGASPPVTLMHRPPAPPPNPPFHWVSGRRRGTVESALRHAGRPGPGESAAGASRCRGDWR
jgi:hypothetical protein